MMNKLSLIALTFIASTGIAAFYAEEADNA